MPFVGGWSEWKDATEEIQKMCDEVRYSVEEIYGSSSVYEVVAYKLQVVAGFNYVVKIKIVEEKTVEIPFSKLFPDADPCMLEQKPQKN